MRSSEGGEGGMETQRGGNKPRPNLLPSDFTALREGGGRQGCIQHNYCDKELLSQGDQNFTQNILCSHYIGEQGDIDFKACP